jgi:hypothetical protein
VVRVWFCNQRQKQKRMKFAAQHWQVSGGGALAPPSTPISAHCIWD